MDAQAFFDWLFSEAGAGWVLFIATAIVWVWTYLRRKRPPRVVCRELAKGPAILIHERVRDRLSISFDGERIKQMAMYKLDIFNGGSEPIRDLVLNVMVIDPKSCTSRYCDL